jgi:hypothetical protein
MSKVENNEIIVNEEGVAKVKKPRGRPRKPIEEFDLKPAPRQPGKYGFYNSGQYHKKYYDANLAIKIACPLCGMESIKGQLARHQRSVKCRTVVSFIKSKNEVLETNEEK